MVGNLTKSVTDSSFSVDVLSSQVPVLVDFWAEWCGPCKALAPKLEEIAEQYKGKLVIAKLNVDDNPSIAANYSIRSIPTMILFKGGQEVDQIMGNIPKDRIVDLVSKHI